MGRGLHQFAHLIVDSTVAVFADNSTAVAYLRKQGGTHSPLLNSHRAEDPLVGIVSALSSGSSVHHGEEQCSCGLSVEA